jgi:hypothetical protein
MIAKMIVPIAAVFVCSSAFAQTKCQSPPPGIDCQGDLIVWVNIPSHIYHFPGQRYFGCTKDGKFMCQGDADHEGDRPTHNEQGGLQLELVRLIGAVLHAALVAQSRPEAKRVPSLSGATPAGRRLQKNGHSYNVSSLRIPKLPP